MRRAAVLLTLCFAFGTAAFAQMKMPKPGPEHKKLDMFAGSWTMTGDMKPGPMGPGGKVTGTETCAWMDGNFFLQCQQKYDTPMGAGSGVSYMGYSNDDKAYTYRAFNNMGAFEDARGAWDGDTITWTSDEHMGGMTLKGRYTMKIVSPTSYTYKFEVSQDGTNWSTVMDGKANKSK